MTRPPGTRLHRLLRRWLTTTVVADVLDPAIADLQYEAEHARTTRERRHVVVRGHLAILRAVALSIEPVGAVRTAIALAALCGTGALLVTIARAAHADGRVLNSAILGPGMLAPVMLRMLGTASSRRLFAGSLTVAVFTPALAGGDRLEHALAALILFAPIAAAAAIVAGPRRDTSPRRAVSAVALGSAIATAAVLLARWPHGERLATGVAMTPFYVALFAVLFALTLLPLLFVARAFVTGRALLAIAGLACSPAPFILSAYIDHGTLAACFDALRRTPLSFAASSLPFVLGAMTIGWHLQVPGGRGGVCPREA